MEHKYYAVITVGTYNIQVALLASVTESVALLASHCTACVFKVGIKVVQVS